MLLPHKNTSVFVKLAMMFLLLGLCPLLLISNILLNKYSDNLQSSILDNTVQTTLYAAKNLQDVIDEFNTITKHMYSYSSTDYHYLHELLTDDSLSESERSAKMDIYLKNILYMNPYIESVYFTDAENNIYYNMRSIQRGVNYQNLFIHLNNFSWHSNSELKILPTHSADYYYDSDLSVITFARKYMDTSTIESAATRTLGTIFIDVSAEQLASLLDEVREPQSQNLYVFDYQEKSLIYSTPEPSAETETEFIELLDDIENDFGSIRTAENYTMYRKVPNSSWVVMTKVLDKDVVQSYQALKNYTVLVLTVTSLLLCILYLCFSRKTSRPVTQLKETMLQIQNGNLDARAEISSQDEFGVISEGLNKMAENLKNYINKIYVTGIQQKEAELKALKLQIQPHYLYNTLEVIKMNSLEHDDPTSAGMLNSLSRQLRYLTNTAKEEVFLRDELDNIQNYFYIIHIRYERKFKLEINVPEHLYPLQVMKLILQPAVENAVIHGLLPKNTGGQISITASVRDKCLEISVLDNGIGMDKEKTEYLTQRLQKAELDQNNEDGDISIGLVNVSGRIKLKYGVHYGVSITSFLNIGTNITYRLPILSP